MTQLALKGLGRLSWYKMGWSGLFLAGWGRDRGGRWERGLEVGRTLPLLGELWARGQPWEAVFQPWELQEASAWPSALAEPDPAHLAVSSGGSQLLLSLGDDRVLWVLLTGLRALHIWAVLEDQPTPQPPHGLSWAPGGRQTHMHPRCLDTAA